MPQSAGRILYLGDTSLNSAAAYLAGLMTWAGLPFDYIPSDERLELEVTSRGYSLFIISDYLSAFADPAALQSIRDQVGRGAGLLMIGGWESFHGAGGDWDQTCLAESLPVNIASTDDRVNFDQPALLTLPASPADHHHPIVGNLPWTSRPPTIGGLNRITSKPDTQVLLQVNQYAIACDPKAPQSNSPDSSPLSWSLVETFPALTIGHYRLGRTAAFAPDVAPHWVGGFVDWGLPGQPRVFAQAPAAGAIEVGSLYAQFWKQLLGWLAPQ